MVLPPTRRAVSHTGDGRLMTSTLSLLEQDPQHREMVHRVRERLVRTGAEPTVPAVLEALRAEGIVASHEAMFTLARLVVAQCWGLGPLQPLLEDDQVSDIIVNGPDQVYVDRGQGLERAPVRLESAAEVKELALRLATHAGRRLDPAQPWADAPLWQGIRLHAILPPLASPGTLLSLRIPRARGFSLQDLQRSGSLTNTMAQLLRQVMDARLAVLIAGGTGCGKTTVLGALLGEVAPAQRLLVVEDTRELIVNHPHVVRLQTRVANSEGQGEVDLRQLIRQGLRMRPDRLVVGEVRGGDVVDLLTALNTGHEGGCATIHANTCADVPARIEALGSMVGVGREAMHSQMAAALQVVVGMRRLSNGQRIVDHVGVPVRGPEGLEVVPALTTTGPGPGYERLMQLVVHSGAGP